MKTIVKLFIFIPIFLLFLMIILCIGICSYPQEKIEEEIPFVYEDKIINDERFFVSHDLDFSVVIPDEWEYEPRFFKGKLLSVYFRPSYVTFIRTMWGPYAQDLDKFEFFYVQHIKKEYRKKTLKETFDLTVKAQKFHRKYKFIENIQKEVKGRSVFVHCYEYFKKGKDISGLLVMFSLNDVHCVATFEADPQTFKKNKAIYNKIAESFAGICKPIINN